MFEGVKKFLGLNKQSIEAMAESAAIKYLTRMGINEDRIAVWNDELLQEIESRTDLTPDEIVARKEAFVENIENVSKKLMQSAVPYMDASDNFLQEKLVAFADLFVMFKDCQRNFKDISQDDPYYKELRWGYERHLTRIYEMAKIVWSFSWTKEQMLPPQPIVISKPILPEYYQPSSPIPGKASVEGDKVLQQTNQELMRKNAELLKKLKDAGFNV